MVSFYCFFFHFYYYHNTGQIHKNKRFQIKFYLKILMQIFHTGMSSFVFCFVFSFKCVFFYFAEWMRDSRQQERKKEKKKMEKEAASATQFQHCRRMCNPMFRSFVFFFGIVYSPNASQGALQYTRPCASLIPLHQYLATGHETVILRNWSDYREPLERNTHKNR